MTSSERFMMTEEEQVNAQEDLEKLNGLFAQFASDRPRLEVLNDIVEYAYEWVHRLKNQTPQAGEAEEYRTFITEGFWATQYEEEASYALLFFFLTYISAANAKASRLALQGGIRGVLDTAIMLEHAEKESARESQC